MLTPAIWLLNNFNSGVVNNMNNMMQHNDAKYDSSDKLADAKREVDALIMRLKEREAENEFLLRKCGFQEQVIKNLTSYTR